MNLPQQTQAILLLNISFGKNDPKSAKPLSKREWSRFAVWLKDHGLEPSSLLKGNVQSQLSGLLDKSISANRIQTLLERGTALGLALEKWERAGLWVITRSDSEYPERLKRRLKLDSPAVLFGCGNKSLLNKGGVAVIGSRDANEEDLNFTHNIGKQTAFQGHSIVSGGARGVDQSAMFGALENEGTAIGVMADSLLKASSSARYRKKIMSEDLILVTPFNPEAGFNVGNAMARNRYIYCLADTAIVISSTANKGGTWNGAIENLKAGWVPLWINNTENLKSGNSLLVSNGAQWLPGSPLSITGLMRKTEVNVKDNPNVLQLKQQETPKQTRDTEQDLEVQETLPPVQEIVYLDALAKKDAAELQAIDLFQLFILKVQKVTKEAALKADEIALLLELEKSQTNAWLKRGVAERFLEKRQRPVRYQGAELTQKQGSLF